MRDLPPTATLRTFEVATRHATFTSAAAELFITQSAVSHQLKNLEEIWGLQLFERGKTLRLTPAGAALAPLVREFFSKLEATLADLREQNGRVRLRVNTTYSFALKWLLPRLPGLARLHPEILVTLESSDEAINFASTDSDVAIRFGHGNYPALHTEFMFREQLFPVASPALLRRFGAPSEPAELLRYPLLTRDGADLVPKWDVWFERVGIHTDVLHESVRFADTNMTIEAALLGHGVALARSGHVEKEIAERSLIRLFDIPFPSPAAYYFVCPRGIETQPHIVKFRSWLLAQSQQAQLRYAQA
ncbi:transcriptional regulator GcvA [Pandoraea sp. CB10b_02]|uniref:LysR family transcriptional regulator n=2 Tax=Pandoraea nosoerga TaxID=2508296 RepID=A0A5E4VZT7_9BURK|nr:transcriptional regulator GcvA [Pandoraea sp. CB10b_02]MBN4666265.1 transcriptional regulator GcvA [Pandoraea nosoerga]MBN4676320.1 transcriptional regulator GcvA [Pandoraea nosoerga]MBN4681357.1 transcriptional regulator GcvA [Pandoraea nosoerga]VVE17892.1 LysR family transcriptional regulator [Pandoraea nosoerga]